MRRTIASWRLGFWVLPLASLFGASCEDDGGAAGNACAQAERRLRECGLLSDGEARCTITPEERDEASCTQACLEQAECETLSTLLCTDELPESTDAATLNTCIARCAEQFGFHCTGALGGETSVPSSYVCDGEEDCGDGSDEAGCELFDCGAGQTVVASWICDGVPDCSNGTDEAGGCERFSCANGTQVPLSWQCDGADDCGDGSDEAGCNMATLQCP